MPGVTSDTVTNESDTLADTLADELTALREYFPQEDLCPELAACLRHVPEGWDVVHHPLVISIMHIPQLNGRVNQQLVAKKKMIEEASDARDWMTYVFGHERPYRAEALESISGRVDDDTEWWDLVGRVWTDTENPHECCEAWEAIFEDRDGRDRMMGYEESERLFLMPDELVVYRGSNAPDKLGSGYSWTTDKKVARWFATRYNRRGWITTGTVDKADIVAVIDRRNEHEVIVYPENVRDMKTVKVRS